MPALTFSQHDAQVACDEWGCNCGPTALAFALQTTLDMVRPLLGGFEARHYVNPTMMKRALDTINRRFVNVRPPAIDQMFDEHPYQGHMALVRIQWTGPWTAKGANPRWAYRHTHWIATWTERGVPLLFDCNGGIQTIGTWEQEVVPLLTAVIDRADGLWHPTHIWRLSRERGAK